MNTLDDKALDRDKNILDDKIPDVVDKVYRHWHESQRLGRRAVEEAWSCGNALNEMKAACEHGDFANALSDLRIPVRTGQRMMRLAAEIKYDTLTHFDSVSEALKTITAPKPAVMTDRERHALEAQRKKASEEGSARANARVHLLGRSSHAIASGDEPHPPAPAPALPPAHDPDPMIAMEKALDDERAKNEGLVEKIAIVGAQLDPKQLDQIEGLNAQVSTLKSQVNSWMSKYADEKRSCEWWKRKAKKLANQIGETTLH